jgi:hypothetical protein
MGDLTLDQILLVQRWASALGPASLHEDSESLQTALRPSVLLCLLAQTVPQVSNEPALTDFAALDELGQLTVYCGACQRLGMRRLFRPGDLLEGSGFPAVVANLLELRAIHAARTSSKPVAYDYSDGTAAAQRSQCAAAVLDPTLSMTYAEHAALYSGSLSVAMPASSRARLWQVRWTTATIVITALILDPYPPTHHHRACAVFVVLRA